MPLIFACHATIPLTSTEICDRILDLSYWPEFRGYGPIPGIRSTEFEVRTPGIVGTRNRVTNDDGSSHVEEIVEWQPDRRVRLAMQDFSPPLSGLATGFFETWTFEPTTTASAPGSSPTQQTRVTRSFELHARSRPAGLLLRFISSFLKRAVARHLRQMAV